MADEAVEAIEANTNNTPEGDKTKLTPDGALKTWLAIKQELKSKIPSGEWDLWVRPAYLVRNMGGFLLLALPPNSKIASLAETRKAMLIELMRSHGLTGCGFTRYPTDWDLDQMKTRYPEQFAQLPAALKRKRPAIDQREMLWLTEGQAG